MKNNIRQFCFPSSAKETARLMTRFKDRALILAGGTRLTRTLSPKVETVIDITDVPLRQLKADKGGLRIGALCTIAELESSPLLARWARGVIAKAAGFGSNALARAMGTVGGNVVRAHPFNNLPPVFLALDAVAVCTDGARERALPFAEILKPETMHLFGRKLFLTEIRVPAATKGLAGATERLAAARTDWESYVNCVVLVDKRAGVCRRAAIALGAILPRAARMGRAEGLLAGKPCTEETARAAGDAVAAELSELTNGGLGAAVAGGAGRSPLAAGGGAEGKAYAREVAGVLVRRCLLEAFNG
jgi:CO/xanthine dehydrogenase FAD-binding subunit